MKFSALRETSGRLVICSVVIVDDTVDDCVCTSSVPPLTSTVSVEVADFERGPDAARRRRQQADVADDGGLEAVERDGDRVGAGVEDRDRERAGGVADRSRTCFRWRCS